MTKTRKAVDVIVVGAGIAGAGIAYCLRDRTSLVVVEMESQPGYHTTGRSAAFYAETYGGPAIQPLTSASKGFLQTPPPGFSDAPLMTPRGAIHIFSDAEAARARDIARDMMAALPSVRMLTRDEVLARAPCLDGRNIAGGIDDPDCGDLDVAALHQGYLRAVRRAGHAILPDTVLETAVYDGGLWHVSTSQGEVRGRVLVNAAGAWGDDVAERCGVNPIGLVPCRRTLVTTPRLETGASDPSCPVILDVGERFYFRPEGEGYLISPADETPVPPTDIQPDMEDVALAIDHFEKATGLTVPRINAKWAGLRTFARDRLPVIGFDAVTPAFFWSVGQGGWGIQTSPAWTALAAALLIGDAIPDEMAPYGLEPRLYAPSRFHRVSADAMPA